METPPILELANVSAGYGRTTVLRDLSLSASPSSVTAVLGPNGAGKTTLLKVISGMLRPTTGSVRLGGQDVTRLDPNRRVALGLCHIPEGRGVFRSLTVRENLRLQAEPGSESESLDRAVEISPVLGRKLGQTVRTMSGGEQQMLAMVRAYIRNPKLVLVDEASLGLAPRIVDSIFEFLGQLASQGATLIIVDQFVTRTLGLADRVYLLSHGEITFSGTADEMGGRDLFHDYVFGALGASEKQVPVDGRSPARH